MRRELVDRRGWLSAREFIEDWALSKLSPGINQVALTALIGRRLLGTPGAAVSVVSMLLPAGAITAIMTAGYTVVRDDPLVLAALSGAGPVTAGMATGVAVTFARGSVRRGARAIADWSYMAIAIAIGVLTDAHPLAVIAIGIAVGGSLLRGEPQRASADPGG